MLTNAVLARIQIDSHERVAAAAMSRGAARRATPPNFGLVVHAAVGGFLAVAAAIAPIRAHGRPMIKAGSCAACAIGPGCVRC